MNNRTVEILETTLGNHGSVEITGTSEVTGAFTALYFVENTVVADSTDATGYSNADLSSFTVFYAGTIVYGKWSAITLTSGEAIGYIG